MTQMLFSRAACAGLAVLFGSLLLGVSSIPVDSAKKRSNPKPVVIEAAQISFERDKPIGTRFGQLEWLASLRLTSPSKKFGGYSGLAIDKTGTKLLAVSDIGTWLSARLVYRNGRMEKLTNARIGKIKGLGGKLLKGKFASDSESIAMVTPGAVAGKAYISFERRHRIAVHRVTADGIGPAIRHMKLPGQVRSAKGNSGIEGITVMRAGPAKGSVLAFTEEYLAENGDHLGWLIGGPRPGRVTLKRYNGFAITDLANLGNGDVVVLERKFRFTEGVKTRLRRIKASQIRAGAELDGKVLLESDDVREIDNMEGLAVHQDEGGRDILTIISDNNFNQRFQRTLLMQFRLVE